MLPPSHPFRARVQAVQDGPICPRCEFRPIEERHVEHVNDALDRLAAELDVLYETWLTALRENSNDPVVAEALNLWHAATIGGRIRAFRDVDALPELLPAAWVPAVNDILNGLKRLMIRREIESRLKQFFDTPMQGRDARKVRIVVG